MSWRAGRLLPVRNYAVYITCCCTALQSRAAQLGHHTVMQLRRILFDAARVEGAEDVWSCAEFLVLTLIPDADPKELETADTRHLKHIDEAEGVSSPVFAAS